MKNIKKLGFGLMRLPTKGKDIDIEQTKQMVDMFLENGFTYFDTAYGYHNGKSEKAIKLALVDRYPRESFQLATKLPAWDARSAKEARQMLQTSLERTGVAYFDFYLLHNMGNERSAYFDKYDIWNYLAEQKANGVIKRLGFSFHDKADVLDAILTEHPEMEFVQLQINYADWENGAVESRKCYEVARKHDKPIIIMEPVKGGSLADLPAVISEVFKQAEPDASLASWAIRFAASLEGVLVVLSGMSSIEQMRDNVTFMRDFKPLSASERDTIARAQGILKDLPSIPCTCCQYCVKGCPQNIAIPGIFRAMNNYLLYNNLKGAISNFQWETRLGGVPSKCIECGQCESTCPQHISIIDELKNAAKLFERR